uniref:TIMELESS-interacting protein n=1 Tax=Ditylenchus dipsaci TaxID=166011 RepID=A0A915DSU5_9BILA
MNRCEEAKSSGYLDLSDCQLMYLADAIYLVLKENCSIIDRCSLKNNTLKKFPRKIIDKFPNMTVLNMEGNQLTDIPEEIAQWSCLKGINLSSNALKEFPKSLLANKALALVDLSHNAIQDLDLENITSNIPCLKLLNPASDLMTTLEDFDDYKDTKSWNNDDEAEEDNTQDKENADTSKLLEQVWKKSEEISGKTKSKTRAPSNRKPGPRLTENEMVGTKGLPALRAMFQKHKISGQLRPYENMSRIMKKMEYWAHGLYPQLNFDDFLDKAEHIGRKKTGQSESLKKTPCVTMSKMRLGMPLNDDEIVVDQQPLPDEEDSLLFNDEDFERTASRMFDQTFATTTTNNPADNTTTEPIYQSDTSPVKKMRAVIDDTQQQQDDDGEFYFDDEADKHSVDIPLAAREVSDYQQLDRRAMGSRSPSASPLPPFFKARLIDEHSEFNFSGSSDSDDSILPKNK